MATKHGQDAITAWAAIRAGFKAKRNIIIGVIVVLVIYLVLNEYVFVGTLN